MKLPNDKLEDILIWMCLDACDKILNSKYFILWKKSIAHWKVYQKTAAPRWVNLVGQWLHQWFKFFLSLSSPVFQGLTLRSGQLSLWISSVVPWRPDKFHEKKRDDFIQSPFSKSWRGGEADIFPRSLQNSCRCLYCPDLLMRSFLSTDKREEIIIASQRSTWSYGRCWIAGQNGGSVRVGWSFFEWTQYWT